MAHADGDMAKAFLQEVKRGAEPIFVLFSEINEPMSFKKNVTSGAYYQCTVRKASYHSARESPHLSGFLHTDDKLCELRLNDKVSPAQRRTGTAPLSERARSPLGFVCASHLRL